MKDDVQKMELESVKVEEDSNPFFEGAIPKAIFQNAIQGYFSLFFFFFIFLII